MSSSRSFRDRRSFLRFHVVAFEQSGLTKARYCRDYQLEYHQLIYWYWKYGTDGQPVVAEVERSRLLPVAIEQ